MSNVLVVKKEAKRRRKIRLNIYRWIAVLVALLIGALIAAKLYLSDGKSVVSAERTVETLTDEIIPGKIPMLFQYDDRWRYHTYGDGVMEFTGCGPTCLSMVACGLLGTAQYDPVTVAGLADQWGYHAEGSGSARMLMTEGARKLGLDATEWIPDQMSIVGELQQERPIICVVGPGNFTTTEHDIVLCGISEDNMVTVHDPDSRERSIRKWSLEQLMPQIKVVWSYQKRI